VVTFATVLFGNNQIDYLNVLLQSIIDVYQEEASVIVYYASVNSKSIEDIKNKAPFIFMREDKSLDYSAKDHDCRASFKTVGWCKIIEEQRWPENLVFLDADTLVVKKVDEYFKRADIGYTYKTHEDENLKWPINSGVVLAKNNDISLKFFKDWRDKTLEILKSSHKKRIRLRHNWGGEDQASMGNILKTRDRKQYAEIIANGNILFQGYPCEELNETRCTPITDKTHIIHYKGRWRFVISNRKYSQWRPIEKCQGMYELWAQTLQRWNRLCG